MLRGFVVCRRACLLCWGWWVVVTWAANSADLGVSSVLCFNVKEEKGSVFKFGWCGWVVYDWRKWFGVDSEANVWWHYGVVDLAVVVLVECSLQKVHVCVEVRQAEIHKHHPSHHINTNLENTTPKIKTYPKPQQVSKNNTTLANYNTIKGSRQTRSVRSQQGLAKQLTDHSPRESDCLIKTK